MNRGLYYVYINIEWKDFALNKTAGLGVYGPGKADIKEGIKRNCGEFADIV